MNYWMGFLSITLPLNGPAFETASIKARFPIDSVTVIQAFACSSETSTSLTPSVADRDFFIASGQSLQVIPSISIIICWSASALEETNRAIRKDANISIICFMVSRFLLI
jgi:hypothetical protein